MTLTCPLMPAKPTFGGPNAICERSGDQTGKAAPIPPSRPVTWRRLPSSSTTKIWLAGLSGIEELDEREAGGPGVPRRRAPPAGWPSFPAWPPEHPVPSEPDADAVGAAGWMPLRGTCREQERENRDGLGTPHELVPSARVIATSVWGMRGA